MKKVGNYEIWERERNFSQKPENKLFLKIEDLFLYLVLFCPGCQFSDDSSPPAKVARKELSTACERNTKEWQDEDWSTTSHNHQDLDIGKSLSAIQKYSLFHEKEEHKFRSQNLGSPHLFDIIVKNQNDCRLIICSFGSS